MSIRQLILSQITEKLAGVVICVMIQIAPGISGSGHQVPSFTKFLSSVCFKFSLWRCMLLLNDLAIIKPLTTQSLTHVDGNKDYFH